MIKYQIPNNWIEYDFEKVAGPLVAAKAAMLSLTNETVEKLLCDMILVPAK